MPGATTDKGSSTKKWGFRRLSLTKVGFGKQSSIDNSAQSNAGSTSQEKNGISPSEKDTEFTYENSDELDVSKSSAKGSTGEDDDDDLDLTSGHQTVLKHLAQQVKVGMDLTRVTLPTFILEKRSLLEMYADFFAHPEFFVLTSEESNAKRRFMYIVKWYLSSFHTGRKGAIAKKPFNPILGEIFRCHWQLPTSIPPSFSQNLVPKNESTSVDMLPCVDGDKCLNTEEDSDAKQRETLSSLVESGPVPWANEHDATFVAEQVSHHPPISAFYAECISKRVEVSGYFHPKSKFMGLSIGVNMIGGATVKLLDRDEIYTVGFPNAYGRSILTVPWSELGGKCQISCESTGFKAQITFHTKNFYSKDRHLITCECFQPDGSKFCTIKGQWNDKMFISLPGQKSGSGGGGSSELFLDTGVMRANKKQVRSLEEQEANESQKLWRHVVSGLKAKDLDGATTEKKKLEDQQRSDAKARLEQGTAWKTKEFIEDGDGGYVYKNPLSRRLQVLSSKCSEVD